VPLPAGLAEDRDTLRADLSRYFAGWAPPVQKLIAALDQVEPASGDRHQRDALAFADKGGPLIAGCQRFIYFASGDLLIAADGSHSALRPWVLGFTPQRRYAGYVNWRQSADRRWRCCRR
jgi:hypothetical protein